MYNQNSLLSILIGLLFITTLNSYSQTKSYLVQKPFSKWHQDSSQINILNNIKAFRDSIQYDFDTLNDFKNYPENAVIKLKFTGLSDNIQSFIDSSIVVKDSLVINAESKIKKICNIQPYSPMSIRIDQLNMDLAYPDKVDPKILEGNSKPGLNQVLEDKNNFYLPSYPEIKNPINEINTPPDYILNNKYDSISTRDFQKKLLHPGSIDQLAENQVSGMKEITEIREMDSQLQKINFGMLSLNSHGSMNIKESLKNEKIFVNTLSRTSEKVGDYTGQYRQTINSAKDRLTKLKKKYSFLPSSSDIDQARNRSSMKDEPFRKRLVLGGNMKLNWTDPFSMDVSPLIGYKINKYFKLGVKGEFRLAFRFEMNNNRPVPDNLAGYGLFASHSIIKGYYGHLEYESLNTEIKSPDSKINQEWVNGFLIGIGKDYRLAKGINGTVLLLYNVMNDKMSQFPSPLQVKFGVELN